MSSRESFGILEQFVEQLPAGNIRDQLRDVLGKNKPLKGFVFPQQSDQYRQQCFVFRDAKTVV